MAGAFHILKAIHHLLPLGARRISSPALLVLPSSLSGFSSSSCSAVTDLSLPHGNDTATAAAEHTAGYTDRQALYNSRVDDPEYRRWKVREAEILEDIEPITLLAKDILHSDRYQDGECLTDEDEKIVVERLLAYHPHSEDKIGCGLHSIMVDRHPQFRNARCLFVVRTDGGWIDFSYQKCLRAYIRQKYPVRAERFIREHFKRT